MEALEFLRERNRMCKSFNRCFDGCPAWGGSCKLETGTDFECEADKQVEIVKEWAAAHPRKTRQSVFLKMFPNVMLNDKGQFGFCPKMLDTAYHPAGDCCLDVDICQRCMDNFWGQEVE
jgi:hypothetical protein|nr:MAG TPA: hypothetical protein [Caudoviricetes sp.]